MVKIKLNQSEYYNRSYDPLPAYLTIVPPTYQTEPQADSLDAILGQKKTLIQEKLSMLQSALYERRQIQYDNNRRIEGDLTRCQNQIFAVENTSYFSMQREWEQKKFDLWREHRQEQASAFRDLTLIQKEIRDTMLEYIKETQDDQLFR